MNQPENILDFVRHSLAESKGKWADVSRDSGVPYFTITKLAHGTVVNPRINTLQPLADYFSRAKSSNPEAGISSKPAA